jgi:hypothetical protein
MFFPFLESWTLKRYRHWRLDERKNSHALPQRDAKSEKRTLPELERHVRAQSPDLLQRFARIGPEALTPIFYFASAGSTPFALSTDAARSSVTALISAPAACAFLLALATAAS